jgi:2-oxoglutarate ferredoxin oxidoreductase subunit alpha
MHPARLVSILHFDGTPITARFIIREIAEKLKAGHAAALPERAK